MWAQAGQQTAKARRPDHREQEESRWLECMECHPKESANTMETRLPWVSWTKVARIAWSMKTHSSKCAQFVCAYMLSLSTHTHTLRSYDEAGIPHWPAVLKWDPRLHQHRPNSFSDSDYYFHIAEDGIKSLCILSKCSSIEPHPQPTRFSFLSVFNFMCLHVLPACAYVCATCACV